MNQQQGKTEPQSKREKKKKENLGYGGVEFRRGWHLGRGRV